MFFILLFVLYLVNTNAYKFPSYGPFRWYGCHNLKPMIQVSKNNYIPSIYTGGRMIKSPDGLNFWSEYKTLDSCRQACYDKEECVAYYVNTTTLSDAPSGCFLARHCELLDKSAYAKTLKLDESSEAYHVYYKDTFDDKTYDVYPSGYKFDTKEGKLQTELSNYTVMDCYRACAAQGANCKAFRYFFQYTEAGKLNYNDNSYPGSCETYTKSTYKPYILDPEIEHEDQNLGKVYMSNLYVMKPPTSKPTMKPTVPTKKPTQSSPTVPSSPTQSSPTVPSAPTQSSPTQSSPTVPSQSNNPVMVPFIMILLLIMINTIL